MRPLLRQGPGRWYVGPAVMLAGLIAPAAGQAPPAKPIDFAHDIAPILKARCAECHTNGKYKGSLSLDTREAILKAKVVVPGRSGQSELFNGSTATRRPCACPLRATGSRRRKSS